MIDTDDTVFIRVGSHRAAKKAARLLGGKLDWHYTWETGGVLAKVPTDRLEELRRIPGITKARLASEPAPCWSTS